MVVVVVIVLLLLLFHVFSLIFCAMVMRHYTEANLTRKSYTTTKYALKVVRSVIPKLLYLKSVKFPFLFVCLFCCSFTRALLHPNCLNSMSS